MVGLVKVLEGDKVYTLEYSHGAKHVISICSNCNMHFIRIVLILVLGHLKESSFTQLSWNPLIRLKQTFPASKSLNAIIYYTWWRW